MSDLVARSSYPSDTRDKYDAFFDEQIVPLLGPCPEDYLPSSEPVSFMCDDHTPVEIGWVFKPTGGMSVQYAIDALSSDGTPLSPRQNLTILQNLAIEGRCQNFDISWSRKCAMSLLYPGEDLPADLRRTSQFFIGD